MNPERYTEIANLASERYLSVLTVYRGLLFRAQQSPFTDKSARALRSHALEIGRAFLNSEMERITRELRNTALDSITDAHTDVSVSLVSVIPNDLEAFLTQSEGYLFAEIQSQIARDAESLVRRYREFSVEANLIHRSTGKSIRTSIVAVANEASDRVRFQFRDRGGRLYNSSKFVRTVWRQTLLSVGAEFYLLEAASLGAKVIELVTNDTHSQWNGYHINLADPTAFMDIRDEVFHPNSNVVLKAVPNV